jgi:hypothetical protein
LDESEKIKMSADMSYYETFKEEVLQIVKSQSDLLREIKVIFIIFLALFFFFNKKKINEPFFRILKNFIAYQIF